MKKKRPTLGNIVGCQSGEWETKRDKKEKSMHKIEKNLE